MTTKFSRGSAVQTLPPVCRFTPPPPPPMDLPIYPDLEGYCQFQIHRGDGSYETYEMPVSIPWDALHQDWRVNYGTDIWNWNCRIGPPIADEPLKVWTEIYARDGYLQTYIWYAPAYTIQQPWASGEHFDDSRSPPCFSWQTFATYPA